MKAIIKSLALMLLLISANSQQTRQQFKPVAVVELFTSEGCSSCPPADKLVAKLVEDSAKSGENVFVLSYHVDYWNRLGWKDSFSNHRYSQRQQDYAIKLNLQGVYTPQIVVNGQHELVGSDEDKLSECLDSALENQSEVGFTKLNAQHDKDGITVNYQLSGEFDNCVINFALISLKESTDVKAGENLGRRLNHVHVVRQLITIQAESAGKVLFKSPPPTSSGNLAVIAYVQRNADLRITGASETAIQ